MNIVEWRSTGYFRGEKVIGSCPVCKEPITGESLCPMIYCTCPKTEHNEDLAFEAPIHRGLTSLEIGIIVFFAGLVVCIMGGLL